MGGSRFRGLGTLLGPQSSGVRRRGTQEGGNRGVGIPRLRVLRGFQPHTDVYESLFGLATRFLDLSELRTGHTDADHLGRRGLRAHGVRTTRALSTTKRTELVLWPFFFSEPRWRLGASGRCPTI